MDLRERLEAGLGERYVVREELGRGGMAVVYLAEDLRHQRSVALKVILPEVAGTLGGERFLREIQVAANLTHPHVVPLYDSGEAAGLLYYVMPYVEGETLGQRLEREGPLSVEEVVRTGREVADALSYAHRQGLVHRDIKPANILLSSGHALVADFGLARAVDQAGGERLTRTGLMLGTPIYMSPEQWTDPERVDGRSDVYALGCVLYEMLVGEPPFKGPTAPALLARHVGQEAPSARASRPELPNAVDAVLRRALAKDPEERFQSAKELAEALGDTAAGIAPALRIGARSWRLSRPRLLAAAVLLLVVGLGALVQVFGGDRAETPSGARAIDLVDDRVVTGLIENATGDAEFDAVGRMATDWITEGLHRTGRVDVVPSLTALQAAAHVRRQNDPGPGTDPLRELAEETGARIVVSGAYYLSRGELEFRLQITDAASGRLLEALRPVRAPPDDPAAALEELRTRVMGALAIALDERLAGAVAETMEPPLYPSYRAFSRGLERYLAGEYLDAAEQFSTAARLDPGFVAPLLYEAFSYSNLGRDPKVDSLANLLVDRRDRLTPYNDHWLEYLRARVRGDVDGALGAIREAARIAPESKASYNRAYMAQIANRPYEALEALEALTPERGAVRGWFPYWLVLTDALHRVGDHTAELEAARRAGAHYPDRLEAAMLEADALAAAGEVEALASLGRRLAMLAGGADLAGLWNHIGGELQSHGREAAARDMFGRTLRWYGELSPSEAAEPDARAAYAGALHAMGRWGDARGIVERLAAEAPDQVGYRAWAGILAAGAGDRDAARRADTWLGSLDSAGAPGFVPYQRARIAALLADTAAALRHAREAFERGLAVPRHPGINFHRIRGYPPLENLYMPETP